MGVVVTFNYADWIALFPQFSNIPQGTVTGQLWELAQQYVRNDGGGPVNSPTVQIELLNLIMAHLAQLLYGSTTQPLSPLVGRINSAAQGSVNVGAEYAGANASNAWFIQTTYGAMYWQLALPYRLGRYRPKITPQYQPLANPLFRGRGGW